MPRQPQSGAHRYTEVADALRAAIRDGEYGPGDQLPSENKLIEQFGASRNTVRQALAVLRSEGLVESRRGAGVYVRVFRPIRRNANERLSAATWGAGRPIWDIDTGDRPRAVRIQVEEVPAPDYIAGSLGVQPGDRVWRRSRAYAVEDRPVQLAVSHIPADLADGTPITQEDTGPGGTYARLADIGHAPVRFREELRSRMPTAEEARALNLSGGIPVILIARTAFDGEGRVVEINEMTLDANSYLLQYDFPA